MLNENPCAMRKYFDSTSSEWKSNDLTEKIKDLQFLVNQKKADTLKLSLEMMDYCNKESSKDIKPIDLVISMSKILDSLLKKGYVQEHIDIFRLTFLLRKDDKIFVPMHKGEIKTFIFHNGLVTTKGRDITSAEFKDDMFRTLIESIYLNEYVMELFPSEYEVFLASVSFDTGNETHSHSYVDEGYIEDYWMSEPKHFLDEEHGRIELDIYKFDDYRNTYRIEDSNFEFTI